MVEFAYVSGLWAGALTSLRFKHLDLEKKTSEQDANDMWAEQQQVLRDVVSENGKLSGRIPSVDLRTEYARLSAAVWCVSRCQRP